MHRSEYIFSEKKVTYFFDAAFSHLDQIVAGKDIIILTDDNVFGFHTEKFRDFPVIRVKAGEQYKNQQSVDHIIAEMIKLEADKDTFLVGVGGGVVTDITGYVAAIYMRGISFGLVPTSILAMVDAAIGGKNGIDIGLYKNMVGTIRQPAFILYDPAFLQTLPVAEWVNGFSEIIKHACIKDAVMFAMLERFTLHDFRADETLVAELIERNVELKTAVVKADEFETGERKLLNFGHTIGHAIENLHGISHGHAVSIGMAAACNLSEKLGGLHFDEAKRVVLLLAKYHLPVDIETDHKKVFEMMKMDKKRARDKVNFILLDKIGNAVIRPIALDDLYQHLKEIL